MKRERELGFSTKAVRAGEGVDPQTGAVVTPIFETSVFAFTNTRQLVDAVTEKSSRDVYTRWSNPTITAAERKIAELEGAEDSAVFSSGMAAISTAVLSLVAAYGLFTVQEWSVWLVIGLFFPQVVFGASTLYYLILDYSFSTEATLLLLDVALAVFIFLSFVSFIYVAAKRKTFQPT